MNNKTSEIIYNLPYINGQYYIADNDNYQNMVYNMHEHLGDKTNNDLILQNFTYSIFQENYFNFKKLL